MSIKASHNFDLIRETNALAELTMRLSNEKDKEQRSLIKLKIYRKLFDIIKAIEEPTTLTNK